MVRNAHRVLVLIAALGLAGCGTAPPSPPAPSAVSSGPVSSAPGSSAPAAPDESPSEIIEEEDVEPSAAPGEISQQAQAYLDESQGVELGALEQKGERRPALDQLPEDPSRVLTALRGYPWLSPQAKALYDKAVAAA
jgi:hypothetical protein